MSQGEKERNFMAAIETENGRKCVSSAQDGTPCLVVENLTKDFGGLRAVDEVNLTIEPGERRVLMGPNGAGKTTLFNLVSGVYPSSGGRILFFDKDVTGLPSYRRAALGIARTYQITNLFPNLTVSDNILMACQALVRTKFVMFRPLSSYHHLMDRCNNLLKEFDLWGNRNELVKNLSHGDQRQIEVSLALAEKPRLLLLDEPAAGLSSAETHALTALLKKLDPSITILLIEHDIASPHPQSNPCPQGEHRTMRRKPCGWPDNHRYDPDERGSGGPEKFH